MYAATFVNRETPMKRLFRALRGPFVGAYGTSFPQKPRKESPASEAMSRRYSSAGQPSKRRSSGSNAAQNSSQDGETKISHESTNNSAESAKYTGTPAETSPILIEHMQRILNVCRELAVLRRRFRIADTKNLDDEGKVQEFRRVMRENNAELEEDAGLGIELEQLEQAYLYSDEVKKRLASDIKCEESNLQFARERLQQELRRLLMPLNLLKVPDYASRISEHDFAEDELGEHTDGNEATPVENLNVYKDPKVQAREDAAASWKQAKNQLRILRLRFDKHEEFYDQDMADYTKAVAEGYCDVSRTAFDLTHVTELKGLTQDVIEAERQYNEVAFNAMQLGVIELTPSQSSWFVDQKEDGEEQAKEASMSIARTNMDRIEKWTKGLTGGNKKEAAEEEEQCPRQDEWYVRSIGFGDGISVYADGGERGKIDKWEELRVEDWKIMQEQDFVKPEAARGNVYSITPKKTEVSGKSRASSCTW
jgi:hypothetical protein